MLEDPRVRFGDVDPPDTTTVSNDEPTADRARRGRCVAKRASAPSIKRCLPRAVAERVEQDDVERAG
jgi:hypothetical protein